MKEVDDRGPEFALANEPVKGGKHHKRLGMVQPLLAQALAVAAAGLITLAILSDGGTQGPGGLGYDGGGFPPNPAVQQNQQPQPPKEEEKPKEEEPEEEEEEEEEPEEEEKEEEEEEEEEPEEEEEEPEISPPPTTPPPTTPPPAGGWVEPEPPAPPKPVTPKPAPEGAKLASQGGEFWANGGVATFVLDIEAKDAENITSFMTIEGGATKTLSPGPGTKTVTYIFGEDFMTPDTHMTHPFVLHVQYELNGETKEDTYEIRNGVPTKKFHLVRTDVDFADGTEIPAQSYDSGVHTARFQLDRSKDDAYHNADTHSYTWSMKSIEATACVNSNWSMIDLTGGTLSLTYENGKEILVYYVRPLLPDGCTAYEVTQYTLVSTAENGYQLEHTITSEQAFIVS